MVGRRNILGLLFGAPAVMAASQVPYDGTAMSMPTVSEDATQDPTWRQGLKIAETMRRNLDFDYGVPEMAHISCKKSWSPSFKQSEALKEARARRALSMAIDDALHGDPITRIPALIKIAKKMGVAIDGIDT